MTSVSFPSTAPGWPGASRLAVALAAVVVHAGLILDWQMARRLPSDADQVVAEMVWVQINSPPPRTVRLTAQPAAAQRHLPPRASLAGAPRPATPVSIAAPEADAVSVSTQAPSEAQVPTAQTAPAAPSAQAIIDQARRNAGAIDRALRKENYPYITAPLDSPQLRMRDKMEEAQELAAPQLWEAPKVAQLVNQTADGARRTRVITGKGTYCVTERSGTTSIDMIEKHGKLRQTNCPQHEGTAKAQRWRTAQD